MQKEFREGLYRKRSIYEETGIQNIQISSIIYVYRSLQDLGVYSGSVWSCYDGVENFHIQKKPGCYPTTIKFFESIGMKVSCVKENKLHLYHPCYQKKTCTYSMFDERMDKNKKK